MKKKLSNTLLHIDRTSSLHVPLILLLLMMPILCSRCCIADETQEQLDRAEILVKNNPDSALKVLDSVSEQRLNSVEQSQYIFIKTKAFSKKKWQITWADEMHQAALIYEQSAKPFDGIKAGDYYYFSGLAYHQNKHQQT